MTTTTNTIDLKSDKETDANKIQDTADILDTKVEKLTECELEVVTAVFKSFETGLMEGTMLPKVTWRFHVKSNIVRSYRIYILH